MHEVILSKPETSSSKNCGARDYNIHNVNGHNGHEGEGVIVVDEKFCRVMPFIGR